MRVNVYAEEISERIEVITKQVEDRMLYGLRVYLYLPVTVYEPDAHGETASNQRGPFIHREGDDDSAAVTFWFISSAQMYMFLKDMCRASLATIADMARDDASPFLAMALPERSVPVTSETTSSSGVLAMAQPKSHYLRLAEIFDAIARRAGT